MLPVVDFLLADGAWLVLKCIKLSNKSLFGCLLFDFSESVLFSVRITEKSIYLLFCLIHEQPHLVIVLVLDDCWHKEPIDNLEVHACLTVEAIGSDADAIGNVRITFKPKHRLDPAELLILFSKESLDLLKCGEFGRLLDTGKPECSHLPRCLFQPFFVVGSKSYVKLQGVHVVTNNKVIKVSALIYVAPLTSKYIKSNCPHYFIFWLFLLRRPLRCQSSSLDLS